MTEIELKLDAEPKSDYEKAKKLLFETDKVIQVLTPYEQQQLAYEFMQYKKMSAFYQMIKQNLG